MTATVDRTDTSEQADERARNRFAARRACAAERAEVSMQESQALLRAVAESPHQKRRERLASEQKAR